MLLGVSATRSNNHSSHNIRTPYRRLLSLSWVHDHNCSRDCHSQSHSRHNHPDMARTPHRPVAINQPWYLTLTVPASLVPFRFGFNGLPRHFDCFGLVGGGHLCADSARGASHQGRT